MKFSWLAKSSALFIFLLVSLSAFTQDNALFLMHEVPQSILLNPAIGYKCRWFIEIPVLSSVKFNVNSSSFSHKDLLVSNSSGDNYFVDTESLKSKLHNRNLIQSSFDVNLLGGGFEYNDYYISFNIHNSSVLWASYPDDLVKMLDGNWIIPEEHPQEINLSQTKALARNYTSFGVAISKDINKQLRLGLRLSYLKGAADFAIQKSKLYIETLDNPIVLNGSAYVKMNTSFPMDFSTQQNGGIRDISFANSFDNIAKDFIFNKNFGFSFDAGFIYKSSDDLTFSGSLRDVGFIRWRSNNNVHNFIEEGDFTYQGFDIQNQIAGPGDFNLLQAIADTIGNSLETFNTSENYTSMLQASAMLGASYHINPSLDGNAIVKADIYNAVLQPTVTLQLMYRPAKLLTLSISNSYMNHTFFNPGAGLTLGSSPVQFYFVTDRMPVYYVKTVDSGLFWPQVSRSVSFRFGFNLCFGCDQKKNRKSYKGNKVKLCPAYD